MVKVYRIWDLGLISTVLPLLSKGHRFRGVWNRVDAGGDGLITLVRHTANHVYCALSDNSKAGITLKGMGQSRIVMYFLSCGPFGCWGITRGGQIVFNGGLRTACTFSGWRSIGGGGFFTVAVGSDGKAFAVKFPNREIMERTGITKARLESGSLVRKDAPSHI